MFDETDDELDMPEAEASATDLSAQSRKRAPLDFSDLIPKGKSGAARAPLDFSDLIPKIPAGDVPLPRARPSDALAPVESDPLADAIGRVQRGENPADVVETPRTAPPPSLNTAAPPQGGFPAPQALDDVPLSKRHGYLGGGLLGDFGALSPEQAVAEKAARVEGAQAESRRATEFRELQKQGQRYPWETPDEDARQVEALVAQGTPRDQAVQAVRGRGAPLADTLADGPPTPQDGNRLGAAVTAEKEIEASAAAARGAPLPTRRYDRALGESFANSLGTVAVSTVAGGVRAASYPFGYDNMGHKLADWIGSGNEAIKEWFPKDVARPDDLGQEVAGGLGSSIPFIATGVASALMGLPPGAATALIASTGALSQGEMSRAEAAEFLKKRDAELRQFYRLDDPELKGAARRGAQEAVDRARNVSADDLKLLTVFLVNGAMGTTEAIPIANALERINKMTGGGITRVAKAMGYNSVEEALQEGAQQFVQNATEQLVYNPEKMVGDGVERASIVAGITGAIQGGAIQAGGEIRGKMSNRQIEARVPMPGAPAPLDLSEAPISAATGATTATSPSGGEVATPAVPPSAAAPAPLQSEQSVPPAAPESAAEPVVTPTERRTLRKRGWTDENIDGMNRAEVVGELGEAADGWTPTDPETFDKGPSPYEPIHDESRMFESPSRGGVNILETAPREPLDFTDLLPDGSRRAPAKVTDQADIERAAAQVAEDPTPAQRDAENYKMGHIRWPSLGKAISIETAQGGTRKASDGSWSVPDFPANYGRIKGTRGADGQQVDAFMGGEVNAPNAYVVDQYDPKTGKFDEHKILLGFADQAAAERVYDAAFSDGSGPTRRGAVSEVPISNLKKWLGRGRRVQPFAGPKVLPKPATSTENADLNENIAPAANQNTGFVYHSTAPENLAGIAKSGLVPKGDGVFFAPNERMARAWHTDGQVLLRADRERLPDLRPETPGLTKPENDSHYSPSTVPPDALEVSRDGGKTWAPLSSEAAPTTDAKTAVDDALAAVGIPSEQVDAADVAAAAKVVAETGATPQDAFQQVMAEQIQETADAEPAAVSSGVADRAEGGKSTEGEFVSGGGEVREAGAGQGGKAAESGVADHPAQAEEANVERTGDTEKAGDAEVASSLSDTFVTHLRDGGEFKNILAARKMAKEGGHTADAKAVEEALELAVVMLARQIVADRTDPKANFTALVDLYSRQPKLGTRTSTSMRDQAFSTPVPLAYVASRLAETALTNERLVYEPTAGNGALLIEVAPENGVANEINPARAANLRSQGFDVTTNDGAEPFPGGSVYDVVLANPPFGAVRAEGESKVFDLSDIQKGYKTKEIDHAIALRSLAAMKSGGRAVLIIGGLNKLTTSPEARSDAYNGKAKREFFKVLYDRYNVTDHFTVAGELYERQGAGWPVDVIVIDGRGKSERALPAVDVPRVLSSWDQLGGLIDVSGRGEVSSDRAADGAARAGPGERDGRVRGDGGAARPVRRGAGAVEPGSVREGPVQRGADDRTGGEGRAVPERGRRGLAERTGEPAPSGDTRARGVTAADAVDAALEPAFGPQAGPKSFSAYSDEQLSDTLSDSARTRHMRSEIVEKMRAELAQRKADTRPNAEVAKSAATNLIGSADAAFSGLYQLFGGGKTVSEGFTFDEETYAKAKPLFMQAAEKFAAFKNDIGELAKRMVAHMRDTLAWPSEVFSEMRPYLIRFIEDVQKGAVSLTGAKSETKVAEPTTRAAPKQQEQETEKQVVYKAQSGSDGLGTLVPVNMRSSISEALGAIEKRVGPLDTYVAKELGYETDKSGSPYFERDGEKIYPLAAEQIDAVALGIENIERGKGFIIGDMTGIGKGRVNAAILRYAMQKGHTPIFVTAKPNLYGDMYRDLADIGIQEFLGHDLRILATNSGENVPLTEGDKPVVLKTADSAAHKRLINGVNSDNFGTSYDVIFTTYNQMQTVTGNDTARRALLQRLAPGAVISFDESHEAGGQGKAKKSKNAIDNRSDFARDLIEKAKGVFYSSATYAKRPDVMDLYAATDMVLAVEKKEDLAEAIARGGVPMQQVVAAMLAKAGQYIRRERSFAGVTYDTPIIPTDHALYDQISGVLSDIQDFSVIVSGAAESLDAEIKAEAEAISGDNATGDAGASSLLFTAIMHNVINQMLLALKAGPAAEMAIEALRRGEKPVITLANTMESLLNDYAAQAGLKQGDVINADFGAVLTKYLDRTRTLIIKKPFSKDPVQRRYLSDAELGPEGLAAYNSAKARIAATDMSGMAASPIDRIKQDLANAGYKVGEITGRGTIIDYSGDKPVLRHRPGTETSIRGRRQTISDFNSGLLDAILLNQAGSTGISLHASQKFKDQRQRHMMIVQAEGNIDTHMQVLGRPFRTGQVIVPKYSQLVADIPAEKRPAAVLAKKMASLNASTTASRGGALTAKDVPDFINEYGDMIAATIIQDDPELNHRLGVAVKTDDNGRVKVDGAMRSLTGRIPLLPLKEQEDLYARLEADYDALLHQMDAAGENVLEAKTLDLKARALERTQVVPPKSGLDSPFAAPVYIEKTSIRRLGKPFSEQELADKLAEQIGPVAKGKKAVDLLESGDYDRGLISNAVVENERLAREDALDEFTTYQRGILDDMADPAKAEKERVKTNATRDRFAEIHEMLRTGARITLKTNSGNITAIVIKTERTGQAKNPLALSSWKATFAVASEARQAIIPFSRLFMDGKSSSEDKAAIELREIGWAEAPEQTIELFASMQSTAREERQIATGNLLAAYDWLNMRGRIINYTDAQGHIRQGILTAKDFDIAEHFAQRARPMRDPAEIIKWMRDHKGQEVWSEDNVVRLNMMYDKDLYVTVEANKRTGGAFFLDKPLTNITNDFYRRGGTMVANVLGANTDKITRVIERLQELGATFVDRSDAKAPEAEKIEQPAEREEAQSVVQRGTFRPTRAAVAQRARIERAIVGAIQQVAGLDAAVRAKIVDEIKDSVTTAWGMSDADARVVGIYDFAADTISIALADNPEAISTAYHEGWHAVERVLTPDERVILGREAGRLRDFVARNGSFERAALEGVEDREVFAEAAAIYAMRRSGRGSLAGMHILTRRIFEKLSEMFARVRNALHGMGFRSAETIFADFNRGEMAMRRKARNVRPIMDMARDAIGEVMTAQSVRRRSLRDKRKTTRTLEYAADRMVRLKNVQQAIAQNNPGIAIPETYRTESLSYGRLNERLEAFWRDHVIPLTKLTRRSGISYQSMSEYLYARDAEKRNALINERRKDAPEFLDSGSGMSNAEAAKILEDVANSGKQAQYDQIAGVVRAMLAADLNLRVSSGLMSDAQAQAWREQFGDTYVPWRGFEGDEDSSSHMNTGGSRGPRGRESQSALGRSSKADNAIINSINKVVEGLIRSEENRVRKSIYLLAKADEASESPTGVFTVLERAPTKEYLDRSTNTVRSAPDRGYKNQPDVSIAKIGGKEVAVKINDPALARAVNDLLIYEPDEGLRFLTTSTRFYSWMRTVGNPAFAPKNFARDLQDAMIYATSHLGAKGAALFSKNMLRSIKDVAKYVWGGRKTAELTRFMLSGGKVTYAQVRGLDQIRSRFARALASRAHPGNILDAIKAPMEKWNDMFEAGVRFALYRAALESGKSPDEAASIALEGTLNFYRHGSGKLVQTLTATQPFLNASIQAPVRAGRLFRYYKRARAIYLGLIPLGFAMATVNFLVGGDDDDEMPWYDKVARHERSRNFVLYTGKKDARGRPEGYKIPAFPEVMLPYVLGQSIAAAIFGKRPLVEIMGDVAHAAYALSPTEGRKIIPPILSGIWDIYANKDFKSDPIHPDGQFRTRGVPASEVKWPQTDKTWQEMARYLSIAGGGDRINKPTSTLDLHPEDVRYLAREISGGWYTLIENAAHMMGVKPKTGDGLPPVIKDFVVQGSSHDRYEREKFKTQEGEANAKRLMLSDQFDPKNASNIDRQKARKTDRDKIEEAGGIVGPRGGLETSRTMILTTARAEIGAMLKQLHANDSSEKPDKAISEALRSRITQTRKHYRLLAEDVAAGKIDFDDVRGEMRRRSLILRRSPNPTETLDEDPIPRAPNRTLRDMPRVPAAAQ